MEGGETIDRKYLFKGIYIGAGTKTNQEAAAVSFLGAIGCTYSFSSSSTHSASNYATKLMNGTKKISDQVYATIPNPINIKGLAHWLLDFWGSDKARNIMDYFHIPSAMEIDLRALAFSIADATQVVLHSEPHNDTIVASRYQWHLNNPNTDIPFQYTASRYENDSCMVTNTAVQRIHEVGFYEKAEHTWELYNAGQVPWIGRKLRFCWAPDTKVKPDIAEIDIPDTHPRAYVKVSVSIDGRGAEYLSNCHWIMIDSDGEDCFPELSGIFDIKVNVINKERQNNGGNG